MTRILIADDDALIGEVVALRLQEIGYEVTLVDNGDAVLEATRRTRPDLIILDNLMPGRKGTEVLTDLKKCNLTAAIPAIMLSAQTTPGCIQKAIRAGASGYITKPFDPKKLLAYIADFIEPPAEQTVSHAGSF